jgi:hypothetical protein
LNIHSFLCKKMSDASVALSTAQVPELHERQSAASDSGHPKKVDIELLAKRAAVVAAQLRPALLRALEEPAPSEAEKAVLELYALSIADNARNFMSEELPGKIEVAFHSNSVQAFAALCDEAALRGATLGRPYMLEAALLGKAAFLRHLCARRDKVCVWQTGDALGAPPLAVLLLLAAEPGAEHVYDSIAALAAAGFVYTTDMPAMVACARSVEQWRFVQRLFGRFAERMALANLAALQQPVRRHIEQTLSRDSKQ